MPVISARDFRANQTKYISMAFEGEDVVLHTRRGDVTLKPNYTDNVITPELQKKIDRARRQWRQGKCISLRTHEDIDNYFNKL